MVESETSASKITLGQLNLIARLIQRFQDLHIIIDALDESKGLRESEALGESRGPEEFALGLNIC